MAKFGKILGSGNRQYIDEMIKNGASSREISTHLANKGEHISHTSITEYAKEYGITVSNELPSNIDVDQLKQRAETLTGTEVKQMIANHSNYQALELLEKHENGTLTQKDLSLAKNLMDVLVRIAAIQDFNKNKGVGKIEQGFDQSEDVSENQ